MTDFNEFTRREDLDIWIAEVDVHLKEEDKSPEIAAQIAMEQLPPDVYACVNRLCIQLEKLAETEWIWTWPMLKYALLNMQGQIEVYKEKADGIKKKKIVRGLCIAGASIGAGLAFTPLVLGVLGAVGFSAAGVAAGSAAAGIQAGIGNVAAGSVFAFCQSAAAGGAALASVGAAGAVAGTTIGIGGTAASKAEWEQIKKQMPSYAWKDGEKFKPSPELIVALVKFSP